MSVRALNAVGKTVLYDTTTNRAFGPVFDYSDAKDFLEWYEARTDTPGDLCSLNNNTLDIWVAAWEKEINA